VFKKHCKIKARKPISKKETNPTVPKGNNSLLLSHLQKSQEKMKQPKRVAVALLEAC